MQPGAQTEVPQSYGEDSGVVYAYRPIAEYGSFVDGLGDIYYLGRSKRGEFSAPDVMVEEKLQKEVLSRYGPARGLNKPSRILLWMHVPDMQGLWERLIDQARGNVWRPRLDTANERPALTHHCALGDNWYSCATMGPAGIAEWLQEVMYTEANYLLDQSLLDEQARKTEEARLALLVRSSEGML